MSLVTEFCPHGALSDHFGPNKPTLSWSRRLSIAVGAARGLYFLHTRSPPIIHRDVKPDNILIDGSWTAKVCDFGLTTLHLSRSFGRHSMFKTRLDDSRPDAPGVAMTSCVGTCGYQAPEVMQLGDDGRLLERMVYACSIDVYSFGFVLYELALHRRAWHEILDRAGPFYLEIMDRVIAGERPAWPGHLEAPAGWIQLTERCWAQDPASRPTMAEVAQELDLLLAFNDELNDDGAQASVPRGIARRGSSPRRPTGSPPAGVPHPMRPPGIPPKKAVQPNPALPRTGDGGGRAPPSESA